MPFYGTAVLCTNETPLYARHHPCSDLPDHQLVSTRRRSVRSMCALWLHKCATAQPQGRHHAARSGCRAQPGPSTACSTPCRYIAIAVELNVLDAAVQALAEFKVWAGAFKVMALPLTPGAPLPVVISPWRTTATGRGRCHARGGRGAFPVGVWLAGFSAASYTGPVTDCFEDFRLSSAKPTWCCCPRCMPPARHNYDG
jgi:hypothetical protein